MSVSPQLVLAVTRVIAKSQYRGHAPMEIAQTLAHLGLLRLEVPAAAPAPERIPVSSRCAVCGWPHNEHMTKRFKDGVGWHSWVSPQLRGGAA
ncbi:hypothetical protein [Streptomyces xanthochromogenes]|uniref:hypothetical protein n=1 Tax=Streptomyces xanthochromogenes TaxID=67384 RepID=UPI0034127ED1